MNLTVGSTTVAITSCERRRDTKKGFFLDIEIPKDSIGMDDLYALLDGNEEPIVITKDDETENIYRGFKQVGSFALEGGVYRVAQVCTSEIEAQLSLAQNTIKEQAAEIEAMQQFATAQAQEILAQAEVIVAQGDTITAQEEEIETMQQFATAQAQEILAQAEVIIAQGDTIASVIDEIPVMIAEMVDTAIAAAFGNNEAAVEE